MPIKAFFIILINLLLSFYLIFAVSTYFENRMPSFKKYRNRMRFEEMLASLPEIQKDAETKSLFLGTSIYQHFLDPRIFDEVIRTKYGPHTSYNIAYEGNVGPGMYSLTKRLAMEFEKNGTKFDSIFIEFSPMDFNLRFFEKYRIMLEKVNPSTFMNWTTLSDLLLENPPIAAEFVYAKIVKPFDWQYIKLVPHFFKAEAFDKVPRVTGVSRRWLYPEFTESKMWNIDTRGLSNWNRPTSDLAFMNMLNEFQKPDVWLEMINQYQIENGIDRNFGFDENVINFYIEAILQAKHFAKKVYLVRFPYAPSFEKSLSTVVDEKYLVDRVNSMTNVMLLNYKHSFELMDSDFVDATYPRPDTMTKFLTALAKDKK